MADNFPDHGLYPIVVTRQWKGDEKTWSDLQQPNLTSPRVTKGENITVIELPYEGKAFNRFNAIKRLTLLRKAAAFLLSATGKFQIHNYAIESFEKYLYDYLEKNPVDYIYATCDPMSIAQLAYRLNKRFNIPIVVDFRDLWNNQILSSDYRPTFSERFHDYCYETYLAKWIKHASFVTSVTEPINEEVRRISPGMKTLTIMNGFETGLFESLNKLEVVPNHKFTFSIIGTLLPEQNLSVLAKGMELFIEGKNLSEIQLNLIGIAGIQEIRSFFEHRFPLECTRITDRIPREQALSIMNSSDVLFYAGWRNYRGMASGKVFEYIGARKNILIAPGDKDILERLVIGTNSGKVADTPDEFLAIMNGWYREWKENGMLKWNGDIEKIMTYSRENQAWHLAEALLNIT